MGTGGCLLIDAYLPGMDGFALLKHLNDTKDPLPAIMITGVSDVPMAVQAMKAGAIDFIEKPVGTAELLSGIERALAQRDANLGLQWRAEARRQLARLTARQRQIMAGAGRPSQQEYRGRSRYQPAHRREHRNAIMTRTGCKSLPALARLALAASSRADQAGLRPSDCGERSVAREGSKDRLVHGGAGKSRLTRKWRSLRETALESQEISNYSNLADCEIDDVACIVTTIITAVGTCRARGMGSAS